MQNSQVQIFQHEQTYSRNTVKAQIPFFDAIKIFLNQLDVSLALTHLFA